MLCERWDKEFGSLIPLAETLTPYAVRPRYDTDFWPSLDEGAGTDGGSHHQELCLRAHAVELAPLNPFERQRPLAIRAYNFLADRFEGCILILIFTWERPRVGP
jgi:hypothetical protein